MKFYSAEELNCEGVEAKSKKVIGYCRVSSHIQKESLEKQVKSVKAYMINKGYQFEIITDIGSGVNQNSKGFSELMDMITNSEVDRVVVLSKDRLTRVGFELIENICNKFGTIIEVVDNTEKLS